MSPAPLPPSVPAHTPVPARPPTPRLVSLDVLRGITMFWLVGGKAFVVAAATLAGAEAVVYQLNHSAWVGLRYYDLIWPSFMLMVGVAIPLAAHRREAGADRGAFLRRAWWRAAVLFLLGSLRESLGEGQPRLIELSSALQPIAVAYLVGCHVSAWRIRHQVTLAAALLLVHGLLLAFVPFPGMAAGTYEPNHNLVTAVDQALLGRAHPDGWGTVLTTVPTIATTLLGLVLGQVLRATPDPRRVLRVLAAAGAGCLAAGYALSPVVPIIMKLWTTSYGLASAGWACLSFAALYWLIEVRGWRRGFFPFVVIGANALAAYLLPTLVPLRKMVGVFSAPIAAQLGAAGPVFASGCVVLVAWLLVFWLYRRGIFLRP